MKIYITGSIASGKTTLANKISEILSTDFFSLDEAVHKKDSSSPWGNVKRTPEERDAIFNSIISKDNWIIEDVGRPCFEEGFRQADTIILLEPETLIRNYRIVTRWLKQNLNIEKCIYKPGITMLKCMLKWSKDYDLGKDKLKERLIPYTNKTILINNKKELQSYLKAIQNNV